MVASRICRPGLPKTPPRLLSADRLAPGKGFAARDGSRANSRRIAIGARLPLMTDPVANQPDPVLSGVPAAVRRPVTAMVIQARQRATRVTAMIAHQHEPMAMTPGTLRSPLPRSPVHADATIAQDAGPCHRANTRQTWRRAGGASRATTAFYATRCIAAVLATLSSLISRCKGLVSSSQPPVPARPRSRTRMLPKRFTHVVTPNYRACSGTGRACRTRHVSPCTCRLPRENCTSTLQRSAAWRPSVQQLLARRS